MKHARILLCLLLCLCWALPALAGENLLRDGAVSFTTPDAWQVLGHEQGDNTEFMTFYVPFAPTQGTQDTAIAVFTTWTNPNGLDAQAYGDLMLADFIRADDSEVFSDVGQGAWRQVFWAGYQGRTRYLVLERFAATPEVLVWFRLNWPDMGEGNNGDAARTMVDQLNLVLDTLKVRDAAPWTGPAMSLDQLPNSNQ